MGPLNTRIDIVHNNAVVGGAQSLYVLHDSQGELRRIRLDRCKLTEIFEDKFCKKQISPLTIRIEDKFLVNYGTLPPKLVITDLENVWLGKIGEIYLAEKWIIINDVVDFSCNLIRDIKRDNWT